MKKIIGIMLVCCMVLGLAACGKKEAEADKGAEPVVSADAVDSEDGNEVKADDTQKAGTEAQTDNTEKDGEKKMNYTRLFNEIERTECYKGIKYNNPLITQEFGADPYALVYNGRLYIYMTQDQFEYAADTSIKENSYQTIKSIRVISSCDMVNWTDHGEIYVAEGPSKSKWAKNSWAPAAAWKNIDGEDKFFLYFADGGGGIGVLTADSPVGPFKDPLNTGLITRNTPTCDKVAWLFDPAVLVDDDGRAYIYFGGGVPDGKAAHPLTGRVCELGDDMISLKGDPVVIDAPYLFEDSGIHKYNGKYYYTYSTNFSVDAAGTSEYGFQNGEIACMVSDSPMGPFTFSETILSNPASLCGLGGNNHHCVFSFDNKWFITYHARTVEKAMGIEKGYRSTNINSFTYKEDGTIGRIRQTYDGCEQTMYVDPYETINACTFSHQAGLECVPYEMIGKTFGSGEMALSGIDSGDWLKVTGVDFNYKNVKSFNVTARKTGEVDENCAIELRLGSFKGDVIGVVPVGTMLNNTEGSDDFVTLTIDLKGKPDGVENLYMTFAGSGYELLNWSFTGEVDDWHDKMLETSLTSAGSNGRLEKVLDKLARGEQVKIGFIGGSVTEGAGAANLSESYGDKVIEGLKKKYPGADIVYVNAGLGGTPSALGIMRYQRDIVDAFGGTPDLLFIEFSVNDHQEATNGRAFESLITTALHESEDTAVVLVYAVFKSKWNMQDNYIPMGDLYGLPMVSIKDGTKEAFDSGKLTDDKFFSDEYHPTSFGHNLMSDCILYMIDKVAESGVSEVAAVPDARVKGSDFEGVTLVTSADTGKANIEKGSFSAADTEVHGFMRTGKIAFPDNFKHESGNEPFRMTVNCSKLLINYKQSGKNTFGTAVVYVDGKQVKELASYADGGWNQSIVDLIIDDAEAAEHVVEIKMKDGDESKGFTILAFSYR